MKPYYDGHEARAGRTFTSLIVLGVGFIFVIGFILWFFDPFQKNTQNLTQAEFQQKLEEQAPGNMEEVNTGRSAFYNFFYTMFNGVGDGLENSQMNLSMDPDNSAQALIDYKLAREGFEQSQTQNQNRNPSYNFSIFEIMDSPVLGENRTIIGQIEDIIVHKKTGEAQAIIVDQNNMRTKKDLRTVNFERITTQKPNGTVQTILNQKELNQSDFFDIQKLPNEYISLKRLKAGQILDYNENIAGQVEAVIYKNAEAQRVIFNLRPALSPNGQPIAFDIPFDEVKIVENKDGLDIVLNKKQTKALAKSLYN